MKIKIEGLEFAYVEATPEEAAIDIAKRFGVLVELSPKGTQPEVSLIGTPAQILAVFTTQGGWSTGDADDDVELAYMYMKDAKQIFG